MVEEPRVWLCHMEQFYRHCNKMFSHNNRQKQYNDHYTQRIHDGLIGIYVAWKSNKVKAYFGLCQMI